jgi:hypothetical protein
MRTLTIFTLSLNRCVFPYSMFLRFVKHYFDLFIIIPYKIFAKKMHSVCNIFSFEQTNNNKQAGFGRCRGEQALFAKSLMDVERGIFRM